MAAGGHHSIVLKQDGSVWTTGYNNYGQLGDGSTSNSKYLQSVISSGGQGIAAGLYHSMVLQNTGSVLTVGWNKYGQFGNGLKTSATNFVKVAESGFVNYDYVNRNLMSPREPITARPSFSGELPCSVPIYQ